MRIGMAWWFVIGLGLGAAGDLVAGSIPGPAITLSLSEFEQVEIHIMKFVLD